MSRNLWLNISIAAALILIAAFAGQLHKWQKNRPARQASDTSRPLDAETDSEADEADPLKTEILVRFKPGITRQTIDSNTTRMNDDVEDRIEAVEGLSVIEDEDNRSADEVVAQYRMLSEVEYAEPNIRNQARSRRRRQTRPRERRTLLQAMGTVQSRSGRRQVRRGHQRDAGLGNDERQRRGRRRSARQRR